MISRGCVFNMFLVFLFCSDSYHVFVHVSFHSLFPSSLDFVYLSLFRILKKSSNQALVAVLSVSNAKAMRPQCRRQTGNKLISDWIFDHF